MANQKQNPKIDWGYYATTPRIVRTHYKKLTHVEKWLYVCLKDLCGDTGTCYRTLRVLSEETDLSTGTLSTGIRHLQEAGLIHAEKKRRNNNPTAKEVWHITIVDIWQENGKVHPTAKCSGDEQKRSPDEHYGKNVQDMNNNVQGMNKDASKRSPDEQKRSNFDDRSNNTEVIPITEERTIEEESNSNIPNTHTSVSSDTARALPSKTEEFIEKLREWRIEDERATTFEAYSFIVPTTYVEALAYLAPHGGVPAGYTDAQVLALAQKLYVEAHSQDEQVFTDDEPQGDDHGHRVPTVPAANPAAHSQSTSPRHTEDHSDGVALPAHGLSVVRAVGSVTASSNGNQDTEPQGVDGRDAAHTLVQTPPTPMPAQSLPLPQAEQAALGAKWNAQTMVAKAEELRGRQFSENARPKEVNAAGKLFKRKADLTQEDFEQAWKLWDTQWWHDNNGLFSITDLAAVPKNKSEMRLIIALEKLERAKPSLFSVPTKQSTFVPRQSKIEVPDDFIQSAYSYR